MPKTILVCGGAGYIGSHCVRLLLQQNFRVVVVDNLSYGHRQVLPEEVTFYQLSLQHKEAITQLLKQEKIDTVMHFAAYIAVGESVNQPLSYYENNVAQTISLLEAMQAANVQQLVFSSTAAVYGEPTEDFLHEHSAQKPINPYGRSKWFIEQILQDICHANKSFSAAIFRYFNAAGASEDLPLIGEAHTPETHLIPLAIQAALGQGKQLTIFGDQYNTIDGTCLRDYVHVNDISQAHIQVLTLLNQKAGFHCYNLGNAKPYSVKEVITTVEAVIGKTVPHRIAEPRQGDSPRLCANSQKAQREINWQPRYTTLKSIIQSAVNWHQQYPNGYQSMPENNKINR